MCALGRLHLLVVLIPTLYECTYDTSESICSVIISCARRASFYQIRRGKEATLGKKPQKCSQILFAADNSYVQFRLRSSSSHLSVSALCTTHTHNDFTCPGQIYTAASEREREEGNGQLTLMRTTNERWMEEEEAKVFGWKSLPCCTNILFLTQTIHAPACMHFLTFHSHPLPFHPTVQITLSQSLHSAAPLSFKRTARDFVCRRRCFGCCGYCRCCYFWGFVFVTVVVVVVVSLCCCLRKKLRKLLMLPLLLFSLVRAFERANLSSPPPSPPLFFLLPSLSSTTHTRLFANYLHFSPGFPPGKGRRKGERERREQEKTYEDISLGRIFLSKTLAPHRD